MKLWSSDNHYTTAVVTDDVPCLSHTTSAKPLSSFSGQRLVKETHIVKTLNCVKNGYSDNSADDFENVLRHICPNENVAGKFQMGQKKIMYVLNYGLFPCFKQSVKDEILKSQLIVALFDENPKKLHRKVK